MHSHIAINRLPSSSQHGSSPLASPVMVVATTRFQTRFGATSSPRPNPLRRRHTRAHRRCIFETEQCILDHKSSPEVSVSARRVDVRFLGIEHARASSSEESNADKGRTQHCYSLGGPHFEHAMRTMSCVMTAGERLQMPGFQNL
jgi:hypothetical protein